MPYYPTIEEDLARAKEILAKGQSAAGDGAIVGADTYAAYKLLESFVEQVEKLSADLAKKNAALTEIADFPAPVDDEVNWDWAVTIARGALATAHAHNDTQWEPPIIVPPTKKDRS